MSVPLLACTFQLNDMGVRRPQATTMNMLSMLSLEEDSDGKRDKTVITHSRVAILLIGLVKPIVFELYAPISRVAMLGCLRSHTHTSIAILLIWLMKPNVFELRAPISKLATLGCYHDAITSSDSPPITHVLMQHF